MNPRMRAELPFFAYPLLAASTIANFAAYSSGDASGLQHVMLDLAKWLIIAAGILLISLRVWIAVPRWNFLLPIACYLVADLPRVTGVAYNGSAIDRPGALAADVLFGIITAILLKTVRRVVSVSRD